MDYNLPLRWVKFGLQNTTKEAQKVRENYSRTQKSAKVVEDFVRGDVMRKSIEIQFGDYGYPYCRFNRKAEISLKVYSDTEVHLCGNREGLRLLSRLLLGLSEVSDKDYHIHLDEAYFPNKHKIKLNLGKIDEG